MQRNILLLCLIAVSALMALFVGACENQAEMAAEPVTRLRVLADAAALGIENRIDSKYLTPAARAEAEVALALAQPGCFGMPPQQIEHIYAKTLYWPGHEQPVQCHLVRFSYQLAEGCYANIAVCGPVTQALTTDLNDLPPDDILAVYAGWCAEHDEIYEVARRHGLKVIEDGAQAHGATYKGRQVGSLGDAAGCSLNGSKCLSALGEGGLFTTDDDRMVTLAERARMFGEIVEPGKPREYNAYMMGWNYRTDPLQAAFARSQLRRLPEMSEWRSRNGRLLTERLEEVPGVKPPYVPPDRTHVYFFYPIMVRPEELGDDLPVEAFREVLCKVMRAEGVNLRAWQTRPVPAQSLFQFRDGYGRGCPWSCPYAREGIYYDPEEYPVAVDVCRRRVVLGHSTDSFGPPNGPELMEKYAEAFHKVLVEHRGEFLDMVREGSV